MRYVKRETVDELLALTGDGFGCFETVLGSDGVVRADLRNYIWRDVSIEGQNVTDVSFDCGVFVGCAFMRTCFAYGSFVRCVFVQCRCSRAVFDMSLLDGCVFVDCDTSDATFFGVNGVVCNVRSGLESVGARGATWVVL